MGFTHGRRVQRETGYPGERSGTCLAVQRRHAVEGEGFAPRMGTNGNTVLDGSRLNLIQGGSDLELQCGMLRVGDQQAARFEQAGDLAAEVAEQLGQLIGLGSAGTSVARTTSFLHYGRTAPQCHCKVC